MALTFVPNTGYTGVTNGIQWNCVLGAGDIHFVWVLLPSSNGYTVADFAPPSDSHGTVYNSSNSGILQLTPNFAGSYSAFFIWGQPAGAITWFQTNYVTSGLGGNVAYWWGEGWTGLAGLTVNAIDKWIAAQNTTQPGAITPTHANEFIYASCCQPVAHPPTDPSLTFVNGVQNQGSAGVYSAAAILGSPVTINPAWGSGTSNLYSYTVALANTTVTGISGTLGATEAADHASFSGVVAWPTVTGVLATTETQDVAAFGGTLAFPGITGTLATTEATDQASFGGAVLFPITGTLGTTEAPDHALIVGTLPITGTLATTETPDRAFFAGGSLSSASGWHSVDAQEYPYPFAVVEFNQVPNTWFGKWHDIPPFTNVAGLWWRAVPINWPGVPYQP